MSTPITDHTAGGGGVTLADLHAANIARQAEWCPDQVPDLSFRGNELGGECGEAQNVIKKLERERLGWRGSRATVEQLAEELADVVICADLCAVTAGINLGAAVVAKFNATSEKVGLTTKLAALAAHPTGPAAVREDIAEVWWDRVCPKDWEGKWKFCKTLDDKLARQLVDETYEDADAILALLNPLAAHPTGPGEAEPVAWGVPAGWKLVPVEPTEEMIAAGWIDKEDVDPDDIYRAMLEAAPTPPAGDAGAEPALASPRSDKSEV